MAPDPDQLFNHFAGSALGSFTGDALGMAVEGLPHEAIKARYGLLSDLLPGRFPAGFYTDDTEMMISLLEALVESSGFDPALTAARFLANFHPARGYGDRIYGIMDRLAQGEPWDRVGTDSFGNGSAMRVAPVGFFFYDDLEKTAETAAAQAAITHTHPEALAGAVMQAGAVALAVRAGLEGEPIVIRPFLETLAGLARQYDRGSAGRLLDLAKIKPGPIERLITEIRKRFACNVKAVEAVPPAIASFLFTMDFRQAVVLAVNLGGDTDTIGAMAGAAAGAYYGFEGLPASWLGALENGSLGRDHVLGLCRQAAKIKTGQARQD